MSLTGHVNQLEDVPRAKCRKWELVVNLPREGRRYPRRTRRAEGTYRQAQAALRGFIAEVERDFRPSELTFAEYARKWHSRREASRALSARTLDREDARLRTICMHLGDLGVAEVSRHDVERAYSALMAGDSPTGKPLKPRSIASVHATISKLFSDAVRDGHVPSNPCADVALPKVADVERTVPTPDEVDAMVDALDLSDGRHMAIALCACCGLRRSEALALEWSDFDGRRISVHSSVDDDGAIKSTKTGKARSVPVPTALAEKMAQGAKYGRICDMKPPALSRYWRRHRAEWGMGGVRLHDLRHAYATRLAMAGVHPRVMMELGGWETIGVCMEIYTHANAGALDDAVEAAFARHV